MSTEFWHDILKPLAGFAVCLSQDTWKISKFTNTAIKVNFFLRKMYTMTIREQNCGTKPETHDIQVCISTEMTNDYMLWPSGH